LVGSLVAYKGRPAKIISSTTHKFDLAFTDGSSRKVREKDFRYIHQDYIDVKEDYPKVDMTVLEDFQDESLSLKELTEWLFDEYSAQNAWSTHLIAEDGLYFYWNKDVLVIRPKDQLEIILKQREEKTLEAESLSRCVENLENNIIDENDSCWLKEIEQVALNQSKHTKILTALSLQNTPEIAHRLLLKTSYWDVIKNPYPQRHKIPLDEEITIKNDEILRQDFTHLQSIAIDNSGSSDADDAISLDNGKVWIHIADVASRVLYDSELESYAQQRISNLYLPDQVIHMLPTNLTALCSLGESETSQAISIGFEMVKNQITDIQVIPSNIKVEKMSYKEADKVIKEHKALSKLNSLAKSHKAFRNNNGAIKLDFPTVDIKINQNKVSIDLQRSSESRELIAELMVIAGRAVAKFANENNIVMPFVTQDKGSFSEHILKNKENLTPSETYQAMRCFKRSKITPRASTHAGLGLDYYVRITSPIRRYLDLVAQQQLLGFVTNADTLDETMIKQRIKIANSAASSINKVTKQSMEHYKCVYLKQNNKWKGKGIVVDLHENKAILLIPEIAMMTQLKLKSKYELDSEVELKVASIELENRSVDFKPV
jgi:exoribonuclease-2